MKNTLITKFLSLGLIAMSLSLTACGSSNTAAAPVYGTTYGTGSASIATGLIGFSGAVTDTSASQYPNVNDPFSSTWLVAGNVPYSAANAITPGSYGQIGVGASTVLATGGAGTIQYQQKQPGVNGQFQLGAVLNGNTQLTFSGTIQLSANVMQQISQLYGANATVTSMGIWVIQNVTGGNSSYQYSSYTGYIEQVYVWLYVNGAQTPIGLVF